MLKVLQEEIDKLIDVRRKEMMVLMSYGLGQPAEQVQREINALRALHRNVEERLAYLSTADYAALHNVSADTVRRWIRTGQLAATRAQNGDWTIAHDARRRKPSRAKPKEEKIAA